MKKYYTVLPFLFLMTYGIHAQQWIWSKELPSYTGFYMMQYESRESGKNYFMYNSGYAAPPETVFIIIDDSGIVTDSLHLNMVPGQFHADDSGNLILTGTYTGSFSYGGATITSRGGEDVYLLRIAFDGSLLFLKNLGSTDLYDRLANLTTDGADRIYLSFDLGRTTYIGNDSIPNDAVTKAAVVILNTDGSLNSYFTRILPVSSYGYYYTNRVFLGRHDEIYLGIGECYPNECSESICQYSAMHDSVNFFADGIAAWDTRNIDDAVENAYTFTNPASHYYWEPVLHRYDLISKTEIWTKSLGSGYSPYCLNPILLPGNVILNYGRGGGDEDGAGTATLDDTTFTFGNKTEMLMTLMDTSAHFYFQVNWKVPDTGFINAGYDLNGNAYLLSRWSNDTSYTIGTTFTTPAGGSLVLSKLKYMEVYAGVKEVPLVSQINLFPNPASGRFRINTDRSMKDGKVCVYDILGNCIYSSGLDGQATDVDLGNAAKGIYFVEVSNNGMKEQGKIILQ